MRMHSMLRAELESIQLELDREKDPQVLTALATRHARALERVEHLVGYDFEARAGKILEGLGFRSSQFGHSGIGAKRWLGDAP